MNQQLHIRFLRENETYWPAYAGEYTDEKGTRYFLSSPEADTLRTLKNLATTDEQFEYYCYSYLRSKWGVWLDRRSKYERIFKLYVAWREKYGQPWSSQAKHVMPLGEQLHPDAFSENGLDIKRLKESFTRYANCEFILYERGV